MLNYLATYIKIAFINSGEFMVYRFFLFALVFTFLETFSFTASADTLTERKQARLEAIKEEEEAKKREIEQLFYIKKNNDELIKANMLAEELISQNKVLIKQNKDLNDLLTVFVSEFVDVDGGSNNQGQAGNNRRPQNRVQNNDYYLPKEDNYYEPEINPQSIAEPPAPATIITPENSGLMIEVN